MYRHGLVGHEPVTVASHGQESGGMWLFAEFLAEPRDVNINGTRSRLRIVSPDLIQEFVAVDRSARMFDKEPEESVLLSTQVDRFVCSLQLVAPRVEHELTESILGPIETRGGP